MPSAQFALSTASAARSKDDAELGHNTPKAAARISVSGLGCDRGSLTGVGVNTSNHEAGQRSSTGKGSDGVQSGLQNESDHSDDTEDMGFGCDECAIYAGTVSTLRNLLARARKQTERVRASSRSETTKALERKNEELQKELASERVRASLRSESTKAIERRNEVLEKELASTKATLSRTEQKAAAAAAERDEALSRKIGGQTAMPAQSLERRHDDPKRGNKTRTLNAASTATTAAAAPAAPTAKKRVAPWTSRVRVPSEVSDAREPVALEHASTALEAAPRETAAISGRELNYGDLVPHESFLDDIWPASVEIPYPNLTAYSILKVKRAHSNHATVASPVLVPSPMFKGLPLPKKRTRYHYPRPFNDLYCSQRAVKRTKLLVDGRVSGLRTTDTSVATTAAPAASATIAAK